MPSYYNPYKDYQEYSSPSESQVTKWITTGFMAAGSLAVAYKMGSPLGKLVENIEKNKQMRAAQEMFVKNNRVYRIDELRTKIPT